MAKKYLDYDGLLYFWQKLKAAFSTKSEGVKTITRSGTTFTVTRADDTTFTFTQQDNTVAKTTTTPTMNGTAAIGSETKYAAGNHVHPTDTSRAPLASPAFTGTPTAPTAATTTNNTQIATTAFVKNVVGSMVSGVSDVQVDGTSVVTGGVASIPYANEDGYGVVKIEEDSGLAVTWTDADSNELTYHLPYLDQNSKINSADLPIATTSSAGAMSASDKTKLNGIASGAQVNVLEGVQVGGTDLTITNKKVNIGVSATLGGFTIGGKTVSLYTANTDTESNGLMRWEDKQKLDSITMTNGIIDSSVLPSFVDDVVEAYARSNQTELGSTWLATGSASGTVITPETGKIYVLMNDSTSYAANSQFRWGGTAYVKLSDGGVSSITNAEIDTIVAA